SRRPLPPRRSLQAEVFAHVAVVLFLAVRRAQVEAQLVDDLDAVVAQPLVPAVGTDRLVNPAADLVVHRRRRQLAGVGAVDAAGPLAAEPVAGAGRRGGRRRLLG